MIIEANLTAGKEHKVVEILRKHTEAISWLVEYLKVICPSICVTAQKYPRIFIIILLYILGIN